MCNNFYTGLYQTATIFLAFLVVFIVRHRNCCHDLVSSAPTFPHVALRLLIWNFELTSMVYFVPLLIASSRRVIMVVCLLLGYSRWRWWWCRRRPIEVFSGESINWSFPCQVIQWFKSVTTWREAEKYSLCTTTWVYVNKRVRANLESPLRQTPMSFFYHVTKFSLNLSFTITYIYQK